MLKTILMGAALLGAFSGSATAAPLLSVTKRSGFVPPRLAYNVECSIGTVITTRRIRLGQSGRTIIRSIPTQYTPAVPDARRALGLIALAMRGRLVTTPGPTDMPTSSYYGFFSGRRVLLYVDESIRKTRNTSAGTGALLRLGNQNCPTPR